MAKILHNSQSKLRKGLFTLTEREKIKNKGLDSKTKRQLTNPVNGSIVNDLEYTALDIHLIFESDVLEDFRQELRFQTSLSKLYGAIEETYRSYGMSRNKIAATENNRVRMFYLKKIPLKEILSRDTKPRSKSDLMKIFTRGLKPNERKVIIEYIEKYGYHFPLQQGKLYKWSDITKLLKNNNYLKQVPVEDKVNEIFKKRQEMAWSIIKEKINLNELINNTGFSIQLIPYITSVQD